MYVTMWGEEVVHDNEVDLPTIGYFDPVEPVELGQQRIRILVDMGIVFAQDLPEQFMFGVMYGFDDVFVVTREVEEAPTFSG